MVLRRLKDGWSSLKRMLNGNLYLHLQLLLYWPYLTPCCLISLIFNLTGKSSPQILGRTSQSLESWPFSDSSIKFYHLLFILINRESGMTKGTWLNRLLWISPLWHLSSHLCFSYQNILGNIYTSDYTNMKDIAALSIKEKRISSWWEITLQLVTSSQTFLAWF